MQVIPTPRKPDEFQQPPSAQEVEALCRRMLGEDAALTTATEIGGGYFNNTFVIETQDRPRHILRISPAYDNPSLFSNERYLLRREYSLTPWLASAATLIPRIVAIDFTGELLPRDAVMSRFIEGENWDSVQGQMTPTQNDAIWRELGTRLQRLHQTRGNAFGWPSPEAAHATWSSFLISAARGLLDDYQRLEIPGAESRQWFDLVQAGAPLLDEIRVPYLIHGDPWPKNLLICRTADADTAHIVGLLDHERGLWGDPMQEWVFHHMNFPQAFWDAYGPRPTGPAADFRNCVYLGLIDEQAILESYRYHWDGTWLRNRFSQTMDRMRKCLAECGVTRSSHGHGQAAHAAAPQASAGNQGSGIYES